MKKDILVMAPFPTVSGYGAHSRDIIESLFKIGEYNIKLVPINWGSCPMNALDDSNPMHKKMLQSIQRDPLQKQPDIFIHITIPSEFKQIGKKNIGITAGIETDRVSADWLKKGNQMDLLIMPSEHAKTVHDSSAYQWKNEQGQVVQALENTTEIKVLPEGIKKDIYKSVNSDIKMKKDNHPLHKLTDIPEDFNFLFVGHWEDKGFRESRKDVDGLVYNFIKTFNYQKGEVGLILKTSGPSFSLIDRRRIEKRIEGIRNKLPDKDKQPNIYLVHGNLTDREMNELYNFSKIKAMITCTHGEGYGRPLAEFIGSTGKPIYATGWSGQKTFIDDNDLLFAYELKTVPKSAIWEDIIIQGSKWANVDDDDVQNKLNYCFHNYKECLKKGRKLQNKINNEFDFKTMQNRLEEIIEEHSPAIESNIVLPNNLDTSKLEKLQ